MRAFIAVDVDATNRIRGLLGELQALPARLRVVPPGNLHLTLKFLGEVDEGRVPAVVGALEAAVEGTEPFSLVLKGTGAFPRERSPRVLWIGVEGAEPLEGVARRLDPLLEDLGFPREKRPFSAHLTVARVKEGKGRETIRHLLAAHRETAFGEERVDAVRVKRSELRPTGAVYSDVATVPLD